MKSRSFAAIGVLLLVCGGSVMAGSTFGFATVATDRGMAASVAEDQDAYLGIQSEGNIGTLRGDDGPQVAGNLTSNFGEDVDVLDVEIYNDSGVLAVESPSPGETIPTGATEDVTIACAESTKLGERTITVEFVKVSGETVAVEHASFDVTVDIQCNKGSGSSVVGFQAENVNTTSTSQTFSFGGSGLKNKDEAYIDLTGPQDDAVNYTGGNVTVVSGKGNATYDPSADRITYTAGGGEPGTVELRIDGIVVTDAEGRYTVTYTESRKKGGNRDDSDIFYVRN